MPRKVGLAQNTPEWIDWRKSHIGGSDAPAIMFLDHFRGENSRHRLWLEKTGRIEPANLTSEYYETPAAKGHRLEGTAREQYCTLTGNFAVPTCLECDRPELEFMAASLDGLATDRIVEIKCPSDARTHLDAKEGHIPEAHWVQIQHQLFVAELERADYCSYFNDELIVVPQKFDVVYVHNELVPAEREFWHWWQADTYPIPTDDEVMDLTQVPAILDRLESYLSHRRMLEEVEEKARVDLAWLKCRLVEVARATGLGATLHWEARRGYLNLRKVPEIAEFLRGAGPLDEYRAPDVLTFRVERTK